MSNVGYATLTVIPSARGFASALGGQVNAPMANVGRDGGSRAGGAFAGAFKSLVGPALALVSIGAITSFVKGSISAAGDLEQSMGAIETVFKGSSAQMLQWSTNAASSVGLTKNEFNELGTLIGSQLKNGGTAMDELAPKTQNLITAGADMASMFGGTTKEAVEAISSALKGERDPIERYGVSLKQASIDAKAAEMGFTKVGGSLSDEASQAATLALIMQQTADAHGNFAKEADTMQGQQQRLAAGWGNIKASVGGLFLPIMTTAMSFLNTNVVPAVQGFIDKLGGGGLAGAFAPVIQAIAPFISTLGTAFAPLIPKVLELATSFSPLRLIFTALQPVLPALAGAITQLAGTLSGVLGVALTYAVPLVTQLTSTLSGIFMAVMPAVVAIVTILGNTFTQLTPVIMGVLNAVMPLVFSLLNSLVPVIMDLVTTVMPMVVSIFGSVTQAIIPLINVIVSALVPVIQALLPVVTVVFTAVANIIKAVMQVVQGVIQVVTGIISGNWSLVWSGIQNILSGVWNTIKAVVTGAINIVKSVIQAGLNVISGVWSSIWGAISSRVSGIMSSIGGAVSGAMSTVRTVIAVAMSVAQSTFNNAMAAIGNAVSNGIGRVVGFFSGIWGQISGVIGGLVGNMTGVGRNMIAGLAEGIAGAAGMIRDAVRNAIGNVVDFAKSLLGIHSPSRVFREIGNFTAEGMALGIEDGAKSIQNAARVLVPPSPTIPAPEVQSGGVQGALSLAGQAKASGITQNIYPRENMSEETVAEIAARKLERAGVR